MCSLAVEFVSTRVYGIRSALFSCVVLSRVHLFVYITSKTSAFAWKHVVHGLLTNKHMLYISLLPVYLGLSIGLDRP